MAAEIVNVYQADTGNWYVQVSLAGTRQEFKFDHEPNDTDLAFARGEMYRLTQPIQNELLTREIKRDIRQR